MEVVGFFFFFFKREIVKFIFSNLMLKSAKIMKSCMENKIYDPADKKIN